MVLQKLFSVDTLLKKTKKIGEIPTTKQAYKTMYQIAWPSALETVLISLIGAIDTMMVGTISTGAIAAVGITNQPKFILLAVIFSMNIAITAIVARRKGENDSEAARNTLKQGLVVSTALSIVLSLLGFIFATPIMQFAGADIEILNDSVIYFRIICISLIFVTISITINAAQRGAGYTKISMTTNLTSNVVNLIFNYLLINGVLFFPKLGVAGAAIATLLGSIAACVMSCLSVLRKDAFLRISFREKFRFDKETLGGIFKIASSAMVEQVFLRIGFFAYAKIVAELGTVEFATHQICMTIINFSFAFGDGLGIGSSSLVGQSLGAKRPDLAILYGKIGQRVSFCVSSVLFFIFLFAGQFLVSLFDRTPSVILMGGQIMIVIALTTHLQTAQVVFSGCLRGAGDTKFVAITSFISVAILRPILTYLMCLTWGFGLIGAWIGLLIDQTIRFSASSYRFKQGKWINIKL